MEVGDLMFSISLQATSCTQRKTNLALLAAYSVQREAK